MLHHEVFRAWSVAPLLHDTAWLLLSLCIALSSPRLIGYGMLYDFMKLQQVVVRFCDMHTECVQTLGRIRTCNLWFRETNALSIQPQGPVVLSESIFYVVVAWFKIVVSLPHVVSLCSSSLFVASYLVVTLCEAVARDT